MCSRSPEDRSPKSCRTSRDKAHGRPAPGSVVQGTAAPAADAVGLAHVAFKVGGSLEEFGLARSLVRESGTPVLYEAQRGFSRSVHVLDPDGNEIELYVDI